MTTTRTTPAIRPAKDTSKVPTPDELAKAWAPGPPPGDAWTPRPWVTPADRAAAGRAARQRSPRSSHAQFTPATERDPVAIILAQEADRLPDLLPLRHGRMAASSFAFYRGAPAVMAFDLSTTPRSDIVVQASGDAHLSNFGLFASPERTLVFDSNDFDETLPGPWEWDVKRLAVSVLIAARANGFNATDARTCVLTTVRGYREQMARFSTMRLLDIWYARTTAQDIETAAIVGSRDIGISVRDAKNRLGAIFSKARSKDQIKAMGSLTAVVDGQWRIVDDPPVGDPRRDRPAGPPPWRGRSATIGRRSPRIAASSSSASGSSTSRSRSSASGAWAPAASSSCSRAETRTTRSSSRPRRRPPRCSIRTSSRATTPTTASASSSASA